MIAENIRGLPVTLEVSSSLYHCNYDWQEASTTAAKNSITRFFACYKVGTCPPLRHDVYLRKNIANARGSTKVARFCKLKRRDVYYVAATSSS